MKFFVVASLLVIGCIGRYPGQPIQPDYDIAIINPKSDVMGARSKGDKSPLYTTNVQVLLTEAEAAELRYLAGKALDGKPVSVFLREYLRENLLTSTAPAAAE